MNISFFDVIWESLLSKEEAKQYGAKIQRNEWRKMAMLSWSVEFFAFEVNDPWSLNPYVMRNRWKPILWRRVLIWWHRKNFNLGFHTTNETKQIVSKRVNSKPSSHHLHQYLGPHRMKMVAVAALAMVTAVEVESAVPLLFVCLGRLLKLFVV